VTGGPGERPPSGDAAGTTVDTLLRGRVALVQPARGFRVSLDPILLAAFLAPPFGRFLDVGCGAGALSFLLLEADARASGVAVEIQPRLAELAVAGRDRNGLGDRLVVVAADARRRSPLIGAASFDLVASNPPYRPLAEGRPSPHAERAVANHEVTLTLAEWLDVAARAVKPGGRVGVVYPAGRAAELLAGLQAHALIPGRLRPVYPRTGQPATRVLVEAQPRSRRPLRVEPPLVVHDGAGYTPELRKILGEDH